MSAGVAPPPPRVRGLPLLGSALPLSRDPIGYLLEQYREHGPIFRFRAAHLDNVVLAGPEANDFLHDAGKHFFSNREVWAPTLAEFGAPNQFVGLDGPDHWKLRRRFGPQFSRPAGEAHVGDFIDATLDAFDEHAPGEEIPFVRFSQALVSRQVGTVLVGQAPSPDQHEAILRYTNDVVVNLSLRRMPRAYLKLLGARFRHDRATAHSFSEELVRRHLALPERDENFIDAVVQAAADYPELFGEGDIRASGLLPFFAGVDTVGQTLGFALYEILRQPELLERLRKEIDALFAAGRPSAEALRGARDLFGAVMETLRLYPVALGMPRTAAADFEFAGHRVEQGQSLLVFTTACHFLPEHFPEPERFDIERYREPRNEHKRPNLFAPFGRGPHLCLGAGLAGVQLAATIGAILHHCDLELPDPGRAFRPVLRPSLSLGPKFRLRWNGWRRQR